ncbi:MAG TPA: DUF3108 domain-containing protein [Candidatus Acidoferrales bacterium]|nr:DUF3108 domain-containing protein [Candidatus Acidoferrales bacterium]
MRLRLSAVLFLSCSAASQTAGLPARESLSYLIEWRLFNAGRAKIDLNTVPSPRAGYDVRLHLESSGIVSKLFKVEDDYLANLNSGFCAETLQMNIHEGNRVREAKVTFDPETKKASYLERDRTKNNAVVLAKETEIPPCVHDVLGGLFFIRTLNLEPGQSAQVAVSDGKRSATAKVEAQAREDIKTPLGTFKTIRYEIYLFNGVLYQRSAHLNIWITDDRRKLPVQIRVRMTFTIGTITLTLDKHD